MLTFVIKKKESKKNKQLKRITKTNGKYGHEVENALPYLPNEQVEELVEIDKKSKA